MRVSVDRKFPLYLALFFEGLWVLLFASLVFWFQVGSDALTAGIAETRLSLILSAFHAGSAYGVIVALEKPIGRLAFAPLVWMFLSLCTDLWSVFDTFLHIAVDTQQLTALKVLAITAVVVSGLSCIWYAILLFLQWNDHSETKKVRKHMHHHRDSSSPSFVTLLDNEGKLN